MQNPGLLKAFSKTIAIIITGFGLLFFLAWNLNAQSILYSSLSNSPIPFFASLNFIILGIAIYSMFSPLRIPITNILGFFLIAINSIGFLEQIFNYDVELL